MEAHACADTSIDHVLDAADITGVLSIQFWRNLERVFGKRFLLYLGLTYFGLKGIGFSLLTSAMLPYFQLMGVSGTGFQLASVVARLPWSMKGLLGVLSDCLPIGRYHKRGYLLVSAVVGLVGFGRLAALVPGSIGSDEVWSVASLFCCANILIATFDLLCEGKYSQMMREDREAGSEILSLVWSFVQMGSLVGAIFTGLCIDLFGPRPLLACCLPLTILAFIRTAVGDLPEEPARSWRALWLKVRSGPRLFFLAVAMAVGSLIVALSVAKLGRQGRTFVTLTIAGLLIFCSFAALPPMLARCNLYMFMASVAYMDVTGPLSYFYTGSVDCIVDAPHFSYRYYLAVSNVVGSVGATMGAMLFQYMQKWKFRNAFCVTAFIQVFASFFDLMIVKRWNIRYMSDEATYLFGDAACQSMAAMMATMPMAMLTARLCPRGAEATVFAILAGFQNFGSSVASIIGVQLTEAMGVQANPLGQCNFEWLGSLIVVAHCIAPILSLPLVWWLVPDARIDDRNAFEAVQPPPSFMSPPASPNASPLARGPSGGHTSPGEYFLIEESLGNFRAPFVA